MVVYVLYYINGFNIIPYQLINKTTSKDYAWGYVVFYIIRSTQITMAKHYHWAYVNLNFKHTIQ